METPSFEFNTTAVYSLGLDSGSLPLQARILLGLGLLRLSLADGTSADFPLVVEDEPNPQALFITHDDAGDTLLSAGTVDFQGQPLYIEDYTINAFSNQDECELDIIDGGLGIGDLRNLGVPKMTRFDLSRVPVVLSITGIYLRAATLKWFPTSDMTPWYEVIQLAH